MKKTKRVLKPGDLFVLTSLDDIIYVAEANGTTFTMINLSYKCIVFEWDFRDIRTRDYNIILNEHT
jgi:hypothetical protein